MIQEILYKIGISYRNPSLNKYYRLLKQTERWTKEQLQDYQLRKCKEFLCFAYEYSPYYRRLFDEIGFTPSSIKSLADLKKIPTISKPELISNVDSIHTKYKFKKLFCSETSGTSGQPIKFYRNEEWDSHNRATMFRGYSWYDVKPWDRNGYFWGYNIDKKRILKTQLLDYLQNRFRLFSYNKDEIRKFSKKLQKAKYLHGYSSMIYEVAKIINQNKILPHSYNLKMIKGTSEKIYESYHQEVESALGLKIISEYGAVEAGLIAYECPHGHMHINIENVLVEEENGEIIVTNLLSRSFPVIRYKLGDSIKLADDNLKCNCGMNHPIILDILGRVGKKVVGKENEYPSFTFYYVFKNLALNYNIFLNYQAVQNIPAQIILNIEQKYNKRNNELLRIELSKYFSDDVIFQINYSKELHLMNGKLRDFVTNI